MKPERCATVGKVAEMRSMSSQFLLLMSELLGFTRALYSMAR